MSEEISLIKLDITEDRLPAPMQHPSGKHRLKFLLIKLMPEHDVYCEPFCGMASVFFAKPKTKTEILNDLNPNYVNILRFLRDASEDDWRALQQREWRPSEERWNQIRESQPKDRMGQVYRSFYLMRFGFRGETGSGNYSPATAAERGSGLPPLLLERRDLYKARLHGVKILQEDFEKILRSVNSSRALVFLDPPYFGEKTQTIPGSSAAIIEILKRLFKTLHDTQAQWLMTHSYHSGVLRALQRFSNVRQVTVNEPTPRSGETGGRREMIAANFKLPEKLRIIHMHKGQPVFEISLETSAEFILSKTPVKEISPTSLRRENDKQLLNLHLRMHQLWGLLGEEDSLDGTSREDIANAHYFIAEEIHRRGFKHIFHDSLDEALSRGPLSKIYVERAKPAWRIFALEDLGDVPAFKDPDTEVLVDVKWDGERIQMLKHAGKVEIWSDYPRRIEPRLPYQVEELGKMKLDNFRLDSEAVMLNPETKEALHRTMVTALLNGKFDPSERARMLHLMVFDCLEFGGEDLKEKPLLERIEKLRKFSESDHIHFMTDYLSKDLDKDALGYILPRNHKRFEAIVERLAEK